MANKPIPPDFMIIGATRYAIGRMTGVVGETCDWLVFNWQRIPRHVRNIIMRDVEEKFEEFEKESRESGPSFGGPLGMDMDRRQWERVRALWRTEDDPPQGTSCS